MEIGPIPGIRGLGNMPAGQPEFSAPSVFDVERAAKPGDSKGQGNGRKAAGAEEEEKELTTDGEAAPEVVEEATPKSVDFFA
jgi:hypothetical protein